MSRHLFIALVSILAIQSFAPAQAQAQVSSPYVNVLCLWNPGVSDYEIHVYRQPGQTLVHTITDPAITAQACTSDPGDLLNWVKHDLIDPSNGTWDGLNDMLHTQSDVFCPGPDFPTVISSLMASMSYHTQSGAPQAGLVVNYICPTTGGGTGGGTPSTPDISYSSETCDGGQTQASAWFDEATAIQMVNQGPSTSLRNHDTWQISLAGVAPPAASSAQIPSTSTHCSPEAVDAAQAYIQTNVGALNPADFGVDAWSCAEEDLVVAITQCTDHGTHSTYGYRVDCCPEPPSVTTTNFQTVHACLDGTTQSPMMTLANATLFMSGPTPVYNDPNTVCQNAEADALAWFDANLPSGTPPCYAGWGAAAGGDYVAGSYNFRWCTVTPASAQCGGHFRVSWSQEYQCTKLIP